MAGVSVFTDLLIWQRAREWSKHIYFLTHNEPFRHDRRLVEPMTRRNRFRRISRRALYAARKANS